MPHPWIPNSAKEIKSLMMRELGINDVMELFNDVPKELILKSDINMGFGRPLTEYEMKRLFNRIMSKNRAFLDPPPFIGGGFCAHYVPSVVKYLIERGEFLTAYTPYQPEINQGILQALFEFQSLIAELYGVDIVNSSMYNGSTAAAEAVRMALRVKRGRKRVVILGDSNPEVIETIKTWVQCIGVDIKIANFDINTGEVSLDELERLINSDTAAVYMEYPNFFGIINKNIQAIVDLAHKRGALLIAYSNPLALGLFKPPGEYGADIVVGDVQPLGLGLNMGGPTAGFIGIKDDRSLLRQLPGRLVGATLTSDGKEEGFMLILQTREQHIRRERATSNITTNSALMAIAAAIYISLLGSRGLRELAEAIAGRTYYAIKKLSELESIKSPGIGDEGTIFFREFVIKMLHKDVESVIKKLTERGYPIGPPLRKFYEAADLANCSLLCVTELHSREDIDNLVSNLEEVLR